VLHPQAGKYDHVGRRRRTALDAAAWPDRRAEHDRASGFGAAPKQFAGIVAPVLLALILVISFHPLFGILCRRGAPQWLAATITLLALLAVILGMAISLGLSVGRLATILPSYRAQFEQLANELRAWLGSLGVGQDQVNEVLKTINFSNVAGLLGDLLAGLAAVFSNLLLLLLLFVVAFMALDSVRFPGGSRWPGRSDPRSSARSTASSLVPEPTCWSRRYSGLSWRSSTLASSG
jgi:AI-2 transport protein TqsA